MKRRCVSDVCAARGQSLHGGSAMSGSELIVSGKVLCGSVCRGDEVLIMPQRRLCELQMRCLSLGDGCPAAVQNKNKNGTYTFFLGTVIGVAMSGAVDTPQQQQQQQEEDEGYALSAIPGSGAIEIAPPGANVELGLCGFGGSGGTGSLDLSSAAVGSFLCSAVPIPLPPLPGVRGGGAGKEGQAVRSIRAKLARIRNRT